MNSAYILKSFRTPGGKAPRGNLHTVRPDDLAASVIRALVEQTGIDPQQIDDIILGCAFPEGEQGMNVARVAAMRAGIPVAVPAMTVNRFCSSGLQAIAMAADRIRLGEADCIIAGGTESMSMVPMGGNKYSANPTLVAEWPESFAAMGITAENLVEQYGISRESQDLFASRSHQNADAAIGSGRFHDEIVPVVVDQAELIGTELKTSTRTIITDEGVRAGTSVQSLAQLKPVFKQGGSVTAGNTSQMTDGAAACLVVSEAFLKSIKHAPQARFVTFAARGVAPEIMGIGPVEAIPAALKQSGLNLSDIDLIELNEAFAAQALAVIKVAELNPDIVNVNGGAIALGHPLGCTGAKLTTSLLHDMQRKQSRYGMVTMCIGGGMGAAGIFERV